MTVKDILGRLYTKDDFVFFWGHTDRKDGKVGKCCLSQWFIAPMTIDGQRYHCMEQYLMAEKARTFSDAETEQKILAEYNQLAIKKLGRRVAGYDDTVWSAIRQEVSVRGNLAKFSQNPALGQYLLSTGDKIIVEASPKDSIWGIGLEESAPAATDPAKWRGGNLLGFALMEVRERFKTPPKTQ
ncbi:MAG: NADAR family protein [Clostridium sp.]|nr:NADAR family protein [Clostridium sp.]